MERRVFLKMSNLFRVAFHELNGPELHVCTTVGGTGLKTVCLSFDASKFPFPTKSGLPENYVCFTGANPFSVEEADLDAVSKVADYLTSKFGIHIANWSWEKLCTIGRKISVVDSSIKETVEHINDILAKREASRQILLNTLISLSAASNPLHLAVSAKLKDVSDDVKVSQQFMLANMKAISTQHELCLKVSNQNTAIQVDVVTKIPERDILDDILLSLGQERAIFSHSVVHNNVFKGSCNINLNYRVFYSGSRRSTGTTVIDGETKSSAFEAECSAAAKAISFLESSLCIRVVDFNYISLVKNQGLLNCLLSDERKYKNIQNEVSTGWMSMIVKLESLVHCEYELCKQLGIVADETEMQSCSDIVDEAIADIKMLYDLSTTELQ